MTAPAAGVLKVLVAVVAAGLIIFDTFATVAAMIGEDKGG